MQHHQSTEHALRFVRSTHWVIQTEFLFFTDRISLTRQTRQADTQAQQPTSVAHSLRILSSTTWDYQRHG